MGTVVFIHRLQPADGKRDALIGLLREFADSINADPECLHYSVHEPIDDEATPLTVIQAHTLWRHAVDMTLNSHTVPEVNPDRQPLPSTTDRETSWRCASWTAMSSRTRSRLVPVPGPGPRDDAFAP
jgi:hypothetical protein